MGISLATRSYVGLLALVVLSSQLHAGAQRAETTVQVLLPAEPSLDNAPLKIFDASPQAEPRAVAEIARTNETTLAASLAPGLYTFEIGSSHPGGVTLLRRRNVRVPNRAPIQLESVRIPCRTDIKGAPADVKQCAARSTGNGEFRWAEVQPNAVNLPDFILSPGETYLLSACGENDEAITAIWKKVRAGDASPLKFDDTETLYELTPVPDPSAPGLKRCDIDIQFPDASIVLSNALLPRRLLTNRDRALVGYKLWTTAEEFVYFTKKPTIIGKASKLQVGQLRPALFADNVKHDTREGSVVLQTRLYLLDADGRHADLQVSKLNLVVDYYGRAAGGRDQPLPAGEIRDAAFKPSDVSARVKFQFGKPRNMQVRASGFVPLRSTHFDTQAPQPIAWKADVFLQSLEHARDINANITGRPAPTRCLLQWRIKDDVALAGIRGGSDVNDNVWLFFPFRHLEHTQALDEPGGLAVHELLHNFGFHHGDEMTRHETRSKERFNALRWQAVDTGRWSIWPGDVESPRARRQANAK